MGWLLPSGDRFPIPKDDVLRLSVSGSIHESESSLTQTGTFAVYLTACFGLAFSNDFVSLMIFRAIQAAGSAATISVGRSINYRWDITVLTSLSRRWSYWGYHDSSRTRWTDWCLWRQYGSSSLLITDILLTR